MTGRPVPGVKLAECRACAAPIVFVHLDTGKRIPCNPIPRPDHGNVAAAVIGGSLHGYVIAGDKPPHPYYPHRFVPHFATCEERDPGPEPEPELPPPALF